MLSYFPGLLAPIVLIGVLILANAIKVLREYERAVVFRLGRLVGVRGPGIVFLIPVVDRMVKVSLRTVTLDVPPQDVITRDNVSVKVNAVIFFRVLEPARAIVEVENYLYATSQIAQTTLRSICGQAELDEILSEREKINQELQKIIDMQTDPWGVKVGVVEVKHVDLPGEMQRAIARQAEAERERRAKVINAEGEFQASARLSEAADIMSRHPLTIQLRYLQALMEVGGGPSNTIVFPLPTNVLQPLAAAAAQLTAPQNREEAAPQTGERALPENADGRSEAAVEKGPETPELQTSSMKTISVESERRGPSLRMRV